jgi:hypothetical protein
MSYTLNELSSKYENLWDQQDNLFSEFSKLKTRQENIEYSNLFMYKLERDVSEIRNKIMSLDKMITTIQYDKIQHVEPNGPCYYILIFTSIIVVILAIVCIVPATSQ